MATATQLRTEFDEIALTLKGIEVRPGLKLLRMSDSTFNFYVDGPDRYVLHFHNPSVFGKEFAVLATGSNSFTLLTPPTVSTLCYVWSEAELTHTLVGWEQPRGPQPVSSMPTQAARPVGPMTPPIIIPPGR
jgi:hypothetical protein